MDQAERSSLCGEGILKGMKLSDSAPERHLDFKAKESSKETQLLSGIVLTLI